MNLLCQPEIWAKFYLLSRSVTPNEEETLLYTVFVNPNNSIGFNHNWNNHFLAIFENNSSDKLDLEDIFNNHLIHLNNEDRLFYEAEPDIESLDKLIQCFEESEKANMCLVLKLSSSLASYRTKGVGEFEGITKPNSSWYYFLLAACNAKFEFSVESDVFTTEDAIKEFVKLCFSLKNPEDSRIYVQSDYLNFGHILEPLKGKPLTYHTSAYDSGSLKNATRLSVDNSRVKSFFGRRSSMKVSSNKALLHKRAILFGNILMNLDHDFEQISVSNENWTISIKYCKKSFQDKLTKLAQFNSI